MQILLSGQMATGFRYLFCRFKDVEKRKRRDNASLLLVMASPHTVLPGCLIPAFWAPFCRLHSQDRLKPNDKWYMDEVIIAIGGRKFWLRRAIHQGFQVLRRRAGQPCVVVTGKPGSDVKPIQTIAPEMHTATPENARRSWGGTSAWSGSRLICSPRTKCIHTRTTRQYQPEKDAR